MCARARAGWVGCSDRQKRLAYDSLDSAGDVMPTEADVAEAGFFEALRPAFELNARWSVAPKVPTPPSRDARTGCWSDCPPRHPRACRCMRVPTAAPLARRPRGIPPRGRRAEAPSVSGPDPARRD